MSSSSGYSLQNFLTFKKLCLFEASGSIYDILHLRMIVKYEQINSYGNTFGVENFNKLGLHTKLSHHLTLT